MNNLEKLAIVKFFGFENCSHGKLTVKDGVLYRQTTPIAIHMGQFIYLNADTYSNVISVVQDKVANFKSHYLIKNVSADEIVSYIPKN
jgi:hypothetical protein